MNKKQKIRALTDIMSRFTAYVGKHLPDDVLQKLTELRKREKVPIAKTIYTLENISKDVHYLLGFFLVLLALVQTFFDETADRF